MSDTGNGSHHDRDVLDVVNEAVAFLQSHPEPAVREAAERLLTGIDAVHRSGLSHLVQGIYSMAGDAFLNRLVSDPAIRLLLMSYNLIAVDRRLQAEEALDAVRGHLHDHGVIVEVLDVVGGVVYVRVHARGARGVPHEAVRRDLECALREGLLGFQELVFRDEEPAHQTSTITVDALRRARRPVYVDAAPATAVAPGSLTAVIIEGTPVLLANVDGEIHAVRNACGESPLPLEFGTLDGPRVRCSWHGCEYDVRTGHRTDGVPGRLQVFPVAIADGRVRLALDVAPPADLPSSAFRGTDARGAR